MSANVIDPKVRSRRLAVRAGLVVVYAALIALVFNLGKGHTLIIDNKDSDDGSIKAIESLSVSVDGQEAIDLQAGDRDMAKVRGQGHWVEVTVGGQKSTQKIRVPLNQDMTLLSLPKLLAGQPAVELFVPKDIVPQTEDQGNTNAFTSPGGEPEVPTPAAPGAPVAPGAGPVVPKP